MHKELESQNMAWVREKRNS